MPAIKDLTFDVSDLAMVVLPKSSNESVSYFDQFLTTAPKQLGLPPTVPVVPWEDLLEN